MSFGSLDQGGNQSPMSEIAGGRNAADHLQDHVLTSPPTEGGAAGKP
jgi:hypothetical protein